MSRDIELGQIRPDPEQPRQHFRDEKIRELAQSLKANGQAVPIALRPDPDDSGGFVIIHGERRWRAAKRLGWETVAADVQDISADTARWRSLTENVQREDLSPMEEARAYRRQLDRHDMTQAELGDRIGKSQSYVAQKLRLLRLPPPVSFWIERGALSEGHARQLMTIKGAYLDGATRPVEADPEGVEGLSWAAVQQAINILRPLDWPPFLFSAGSDKKRDVVRAALRALYRFDAEQGPAPAWTVAAWSYGVVAYCTDLSVSELSDLVGRFTDLLRSHIGFFWMGVEDDGKKGPPLLSRPPFHEAIPDVPSVDYEFTDGSDGTPVSELSRSDVERVRERLHRIGALSDLRHAGALPALRATWRHVNPKAVSEYPNQGEPALTEKQAEANREYMFECSMERMREQGFLLPSKIQDPETADGQKDQALRRRPEMFEEDPAV